jgi:hypothetical protein
MTDVVGWLLLIYAAGVIIGLLVIDETLPKRLGLAALWPLGPLAFLLVITILLLALPIALPRAAAALAALLVTGWLIYRIALP